MKMKKLIIIGIIGCVSLGLSAWAQPNFGNSLSNAVSNIDETTNYFTDGEISLEIGGVYVQKTGEGGEMLDLAKWDVGGIKGLGIGGQVVNTASDLAAGFGYVGYRKTLGNAALEGFVGMGYDELDEKLMGVVGVGIEYRTSKHISAFTKTGYAIEGGQDKKRGLIVAAGVAYNF